MLLPPYFSSRLYTFCLFWNAVAPTSFLQRISELNSLWNLGFVFCLAFGISNYAILLTISKFILLEVVPEESGPGQHYLIAGKTSLPLKVVWSKDSKLLLYVLSKTIG